MIVSLPVMRWGAGERRVLLVHGLTSSARVWWRVASELADRGWEVVAADLRGHGQAPPAARYAISEMGDDLVDLGAAWDVVVGHSLGGAVVASAAAHGGWAERLVLVDPVIAIHESERGGLEAEWTAETTATPDAVEARHPAWHPDDVHWKVWSARACVPSIVSRVMVDNDPWDVTADLRVVPVPCTVLAAEPERGGLTDARLIDELSLENPRIRLVEVEGAGHSIFREQPDVVVSAVER